MDFGPCLDKPVVGAHVVGACLLPTSPDCFVRPRSGALLQMQRVLPQQQLDHILHPHLFADVAVGPGAAVEGHVLLGIVARPDAHEPAVPRLQQLPDDVAAEHLVAREVQVLVRHEDVALLLNAPLERRDVACALPEDLHSRVREVLLEGVLEGPAGHSAVVETRNR
eukprot:CAMPEP_0174329948 /NCGR_PEP_ID=MMETSP0810-20121108/16275_1 /TAXON_ID=73025 ORGANISM="Eutreptiella gymnastica-like, Strain CCMP1594" /NCGR_SAMPLE_ID=MMETSP0810 /ASSEMBLY_ACC=CAM_ASM_000659 /LENGTH=166 /DNA_ID=CAMNT_0015444801 /DNA_START=366 /DNA_END=862 /DNA_ORIENTATION=-